MIMRTALMILLITAPALACPDGFVCRSQAVIDRAAAIVEAACPRCAVSDIRLAIDGVDVTRGPFEDVQSLACSAALHMDGPVRGFLRRCYGDKR